jgi:hypothetical protein
LIWLNALVAFALVLAQTAFAQDSPKIIRQIAPDRFQPSLRDTADQPAPATAVVPPSKEHPLGACDRASRNWVNCLRATADLSTMMVAEAETRKAPLQARPGQLGNERFQLAERFVER